MLLQRDIIEYPVLLPIRDAVMLLPTFCGGKPGAPGNAPKLGQSSPAVSSPALSSVGMNVHEGIVNIEVCPVVSPAVAASQKGEVVPRLGLEPRTN